MSSEFIPRVVQRNEEAMRALARGDREGVRFACERDAIRLENMLAQIDKQHEAVRETADENRTFSELVQNDANYFEAARREAMRQ